MHDLDKPPNHFGPQFIYVKKMEWDKVISNITIIFEILSLWKFPNNYNTTNRYRKHSVNK